ncbi:MAG: response regulator transcription factor [Chthoniobacter sp.]|nr:response regulator transcription factor [Chthoniobacter sp.]
MKKVQILVADDHELIRDGLRIRLESVPNWHVCGEAGNGAQAVELARKFFPDVAVLDISMPELNGVEATRQIRQACPQTEVLILTMQDSESLVREVLAAGARGFILKTDATRLLIGAVQALAAHQPFFTGRVADLVLGDFLSPAHPGASAEAGRLSPRERQITQLLAEAKTSKEAATALGISVKTIDAHRANIMRKLEIHSVAELVRYAIREKLIEP